MNVVTISTAAPAVLSARRWLLFTAVASMLATFVVGERGTAEGVAARGGREEGRPSEGRGEGRRREKGRGGGRRGKGGKGEGRQNGGNRHIGRCTMKEGVMMTMRRRTTANNNKLPVPGERQPSRERACLRTAVVRKCPGLGGPRSARGERGVGGQALQETVSTRVALARVVFPRRWQQYQLERHHERNSQAKVAWCVFPRLARLC